MAQGYKSYGPGRGNDGNFDPNRSRGSTTQGYKYQRVPSAPYNLRWEPRSPQKVAVFWTLPSDQDITKVNVRLFKQGWFAEGDVASSFQGVTAPINGPLENYEVEVRAVNGFGISEVASIRLGYM